MNPADDRWNLAHALFDSARALPPGRRAAFLDQACPDATLRAEVASLLKAHAALESGSADGFLERLDTGRAAALLYAGEAGTSDADRFSPGDVIGRYRIVRRLGHGGMGVVYLAHDSRLDRPVALKVLRRYLSLNAGARQRFEEEARAASALDHPNIVTIFDIGDAPDGRLFIAMAYHEGETLRQALARGPLPVDRAVALVRQIAEGLGAAHRRSIVHRDIKPENVIVAAGGVAKIVDFGIAKMAGSSDSHAVTPGTVAYMSPEQTRGHEIDARTDIWSLGVVLHELLAGQRPFAGGTREMMVSAIRHDEPEPVTRSRSGVPVALDQVVERCLAKEPGGRYQTADELSRELGMLQDGAPVRRRRRTRMTASAAGALAIAAVLLVRSPWKPAGVENPMRTLAVIPSAVSGDSALVRIGRELTSTLSFNLNGMDGIRTLWAPDLLARVGEQNLSLAEGARLARRLGATSMLFSSLRRNEALVRLELTLVELRSLEAMAQASVTSSVDDIVLLTDSATITLLREVWRREGETFLSMAAGLTRSPRALRAFLEGERAFARADFDVAVRAFTRAFEADSTFVLAYWRSLYPMVFEGRRPDSSMVARVVAQRDRLPMPERLTVDAYAAPRLSDRLAVLDTVTTRFPNYWPAWYDYGRSLLSEGPYLGRGYADTRRALERVVALYPGFAPAWVQLIWIGALQRDTSIVDRAVENLERLSSPDGFWVNPGNMTFAYAVQELLRHDGEFATDLNTRLARAALGPDPRVPAENLALRLLVYGFPRGQLQQVDAALRESPTRPVAAAQWTGRAFAWAVRGSWDSAFKAIEQWVRLSGQPRTQLRAYGLAVLGVTTSAIEPGAARLWRPADAPVSGADRAEWRAERAWLDGIVSHAEGNHAGVARAREEVLASNARHAQMLATSLEAFLGDAMGNRREAARLLAALERDNAESGRYRAVAQSHPYVAAIHRPAAARWSLATGDTLAAVWLLAWHEAIFGNVAGAGAANRVVEPLALHERARIAEAWGWHDAAQEHYRGFLERYDRPPPAHRPLVEGAQAALRRLTSVAR